eukprot:6052516-Pyramimonas_sp.AAC.1
MVGLGRPGHRPPDLPRPPDPTVATYSGRVAFWRTMRGVAESLQERDSIRSQPIEQCTML